MEVMIDSPSYGLIIWQVISLILIGLWVYALIDILKSSFKKNGKLIWILVTLFVPAIGAILYLLIGRKGKTEQN